MIVWCLPDSPKLGLGLAFRRNGTEPLNFPKTIDSQRQ